MNEHNEIASDDSAIIRFYRGAGVDGAGRTLAQVHHLTMVQREEIHDYIQWLFPLPEPSGFSSRAPILTASDIAAFRSDTALTEQMRRSLLMMVEFYGLTLIAKCGTVEVHITGAFNFRRMVWLTQGNHNFLRITRILRSLTLLGLGVEANALLVCLESVYKTHSEVIGARTLEYWRRAVTSASS